MPIRDRIVWGPSTPFSDPRLDGLDQLLRDLRRGAMPPNVKGGRTFTNADRDLPVRPDGYYREFDVQPKRAGVDRGALRLVLGRGGEVYITGNHYRDFRQVINVPL